MPRVIAEGTPSQPDITQLLLAQGFDPAAPGNCLMAIMGDTHMFLDPADSRYTDKLDDALVNELNGLTPGLTDLVLAGDLIVSHSQSVGIPRYPSIYARAREEMRVAKAQMQRFRPGISLWSIPGNHDTDREEVEPTLWLEEMGTPAYRRIERGGMPVILLNSGHSGGLDPVQKAWLLNQASTIPDNQEVLIIAHHPSFFYITGEAAMKRVIAEAFAGHQATVWIAGGHGHTFADRLFVDKGTRFLQMEVTCANPKMFGDGASPGYILMGLTGGKVACRIFRSLKKTSFDLKPAPSAMSPVRVVWPFEKIEYPAELFEESFYDRSGRIVSSSAVDLRFQFVFLQNITFKIEPGRYAGKLSEFLVLGRVGAAALPSALCSFSSTGPNGPWTSVGFPQDVSQVYRIPIPEQLRNVATLHVKLSTTIPPNQSDFSLGGWGTAASAQSLTGYEKWIAARYRTFLKTPSTAPETVPAGDTVSNIVRFAFNLPDDGSQVPASQIRGLPSYSTAHREVMEFRFARRRAGDSPGLIYWAEEEIGSGQWIPVAAERLQVKLLDDIWEEITIRRIPGGEGSAFYRVRLQTPAGAGTVGPPPGDHNGNSVDDLVEYAFALESSEPMRRYDPARPDRRGGLPSLTPRTLPLPKLVFPRMKSDANPGVSYGVEQSPDLTNWSDVRPFETAERILRKNGDWEEVEIVILTGDSSRMYYRMKVELSQDLMG